MRGSLFQALDIRSGSDYEKEEAKCIRLLTVESSSKELRVFVDFAATQLFSRNMIYDVRRKVGRGTLTTSIRDRRAEPIDNCLPAFNVQSLDVELFGIRFKRGPI
jgi:hypothetical protein